MNNNIFSKAALIASFAFVISACSGIDEVVTISVDGVERHYILDTPDDTLSREVSPEIAGLLMNLVNQPGYPVVFSFHGAWPRYGLGTGNPADLEGARLQKVMSEFELLGNDEKFIVVYPQANFQPNANDLALFWRGGASSPDDDLKFFDAMLQKLKNDTHFKIDEDRIYVTGFSSGGGITRRIACERTDKISGAAVVDSNLSPYNCNDWENSLSKISDAGLDMMVFTVTGNEFFEILGPLPSRLPCGEPEETYRDDISNCAEFPQCGGGVDIKVCFRDNGEHSWPGGPLLENENIKATNEIWSFFNE